jgi:quinol monooxygenase YgiN
MSRLQRSKSAKHRRKPVIHVVAIITARPGQRGAVLEAFAANRPAVLAEAGCIAYEAATDTEGMGPIQTPVGPDAFVVIERWESADHLKAHAVAPHMKAYGAKMKDLLASRVIHVLSPV